MRCLYSLRYCLGMVRFLRRVTLRQRNSLKRTALRGKKAKAKDINARPYRAKVDEYAAA